MTQTVSAVEVTADVTDCPQLKPCPFCGGGTTDIKENRLPPKMNGPGSIISVEIRHWCPQTPGCIGGHISVRGRDMESAVNAWNRRAGGQS
jgi:hypothetical protein